MFNPFIGICKFFMAVLVVAIHVEPFQGDMAFYYNNCLARIADPMFFTLSAYFLFDKLLSCNWDSSIFKKQIKRLFQYYGVWLIVYAPVICSRTYERTDNWFDFALQILKQIFLSGPYGALWFLPALILGLTLTYLVGKHFTPRFGMLISLPFFLLTVLEMEYFALVKDITWLNVLNNFFVSIFGWLGNGINFAWFFCAMGLYLASKKNNPPRRLAYNVRDLCNYLAILAVECTLIRRYNLGVSYGVMLSLIPVTFYLMQVLLQLPHTSKKDPNHRIGKYLQDMSLLIFPLHFGIMEGLEYLMQNHSWYTNSTILPYMVVLLLTCGISAILLKLGKRYAFFRIFYGK